MPTTLLRVAIYARVSSERQAQEGTIASQLAAKPGKNLETRIRKNIQLQQAVVKRAGEMEDYLNWFEATRLDTPSREFDSHSDPRTSFLSFRRNDAVSRYLDYFEARGW